MSNPNKSRSKEAVKKPAAASGHGFTRHEKNPFQRPVKDNNDSGQVRHGIVKLCIQHMVLSSIIHFNGTIPQVCKEYA